MGSVHGGKTEKKNSESKSIFYWLRNKENYYFLSYLIENYERNIFLLAYYNYTKKGRRYCKIVIVRIMVEVGL